MKNGRRSKSNCHDFLRTHQQRAEAVGAILDALYPSPQIPLAHSSPYTLLVAVLLSAQTTDAQVNRITPQLFAGANTPQGMVRLSEEEIGTRIRSCGLWRNKARAILALSHTLIDRYGGEVPRDLTALESLPGVGHKTASVVLVQGFGIPAFPVDTHIYRSAHRWGLSRGKTVEAVEKDLKNLFPKELWGKRHLQIILFAREHCPARGHCPSECPICRNSYETSLP